MILTKTGISQQFLVQTINMKFKENLFDGSRDVSWLQTDKRADG
jgi:N-acetyl-anhydromuramyl-L-alanine amidase AmpD